MTHATPNDYWISQTALYIELNALGIPDYIQANCVSGAVIMCHMVDIPGLDLDAGHNPRRWSLQAFPTVFNTHTMKYVYAAIPRNDNTKPAQIVFPSEIIDIYGMAERPIEDDEPQALADDADDATEGEEGADDETPKVVEVQVGDPAYYYINLGGIITSSGENGTINRDWYKDEYGVTHKVNTGILDTFEQRNSSSESEWYKYSSVDQTTTFLKKLTMKVGTWFIDLFAKTIKILKGGSLVFEESGTIRGVAADSTPAASNDTIVTPVFADSRYLSKKHDDKAEGHITLAKGATVGESPTLSADMQHWGKSEWGTFIKGIIGGSGAQIDIQGNAELESLIIRRFLEVPELRYNRVSVHSGTEWFTKGSGIIESVEVIDRTHGKVKLKLEDGEISTIAEDDYCMGIFHNLDGNATATTDDKQGTMQYAGFSTVYFRIEKITETHYNSEFTYELRPISLPTPTTSGWSYRYHPQPQMTFACYANPNRNDRQSGVLKTTDYTVYIENSTQWTFGPDNYYLIMGQLDGFSVWATNKKGQRYLKRLKGNGSMLGNVYMFGVIDQFDRLADTVEVTASPRINADYSLADGETLYLNARMLSYDGLLRDGVTYSIKRYSDNPDSDVEWNTRRGNDIAGGTIALTLEDTIINPLSFGEGQGGAPVYDLAVQFTITGTRQLPSDEGGEDYSVERDIVVKNMGSNTIVSDLADQFFDMNIPKRVNFSVYSARGEDITAKVSRWSIERHSSSTESDIAWQNREKVQNFSGSIEFLWSDNPDTDDFDPDETVDATEFVIKAYDSDDGTLAMAKTMM